MSLVVPIPHIAQLFNSAHSNFVVAPPIIQAGHSLTVQGTDFPWAIANSLYLGWDRHNIDYDIFQYGDIQYGADIIGSHSVSPVVYMTESVKFNPGDSYNTRVKIAPLGSSSRYQVRARNVHHLDEFGPLTRGPWTDWLYLRTTMSDIVHLVIQDGAGSINANVPLQMTGSYLDSSFNTTIPIPPTMKPGTYTIEASINGTVISSSQFTIAAPGN